MSSLVKVRRVLPLVYPEIFSASSSPVCHAAGELPAPVNVTAAASPAAGGESDADLIRAKRLKSLYQRSLRNQQMSETLTYSGRLSA